MQDFSAADDRTDVANFVKLPRVRCQPADDDDNPTSDEDAVVRVKDVFQKYERIGKFVYDDVDEWGDGFFDNCTEGHFRFKCFNVLSYPKCKKGAGLFNELNGIDFFKCKTKFSKVRVFQHYWFLCGSDRGIFNVQLFEGHDFLYAFFVTTVQVYGKWKGIGEDYRIRGQRLF